MNIVLSKSPIEQEGVVQCRSMEELMEEIAKFDPDSVFLIGGASMYDQLADCCTEALITRVDAIGDADRSIQSFDERDNWELVEVSDVQEDNGFRFVFTKYINHDVKERPDGVGTAAEESVQENGDQEGSAETVAEERADSNAPAENQDEAQ